MTPVEKRDQAFARSHQLRRVRVEIRRHLRHGEMSLAQALQREAAQRMRVVELLTAVKWIGPTRSVNLLRLAGVSPLMADQVRVAELTLVQRLALLAAYGSAA